MKKSVKIFLRVIIALLTVVILIGATLGIYYAASKTCTLTVKVSEDEPLQEISGWGTSDCWWADDISDEQTRNEIADYLFSDDGLNLDTYRYCLYGGYDPENNVVTNEWRLGESFLVYNDETGEYAYDWSRDANSQAMLQAALDRGVDTVVLFANSPHYSMCRNGRSSGHESGSETNIDPSRYEDYVDYFLTITQHFIDEGVPVKYISPINEPQWGWGGDAPAQEGCHYEPEEAVALLKIFAQQIVERGMDVQLYALESGNIGDTAKNYYDLMMADEDISKVLGVYSFHSYFNDSDKIKKDRFGNWISDTVTVRADMSEWCELPSAHDASDPLIAVIMARVISNDIGCLNVNCWSNWVAMNEMGVNPEDGNDYSDGLLVANAQDTTDYYVAYRYYGYMHYSRFIPAGSTVLKCSDGVFTVATYKDDEGTHFRELVNETAYLTPEGNVVVVVVNEGEARDIKFDLDGYTNVTVYTTDSEHKCEQVYSGDAQDSYESAQNSVSTYIFSK